MFLDRVNNVDPLVVASWIKAGKLAHFVAFLTDLARSLQYQGEMGPPLDYGEMQIPRDEQVSTTVLDQSKSILSAQLNQSEMVAPLEATGAIHGLRSSIHSITRNHPALRNKLKDCITWLLALYDTSISHAIQDSQLRGHATHHLSSELYGSIQDDWFSLSIREETGTSKSNSVVVESKLSLVQSGYVLRLHIFIYVSIDNMDFGCLVP